MHFSPSIITLGAFTFIKNGSRLEIVGSILFLPNFLLFPTRRLHFSVNVNITRIRVHLFFSPHFSFLS